MRDWLYPGAKVVFVGPQFSGVGYGNETLPEIGEVYTVREILSRGDALGIRLSEIVNQARLYTDPFNGGWALLEPVFAASHFRPLQKRKTSIEIFQRMLTDAPNQKERLDA